jgi:hypothetical protein
MRYSLPKKNKEFILIPPIDEIKTLVEANHELLNKIKIDKIPFQELRTQLHKSINKNHIIATGHQPVIYHPGIIFKDMVVNALTNRYGFSGLNLVVDSDVIGNNQYISIPTLKYGKLSCKNIQLFHFEKNLAFEEIPSPDKKNFNQTLTYIKNLLPKECIEGLNNYITAVNKAFSSAKNLAQFNAFSKRAFEEKLGFKHKEIFLSSICQSKAFLYFFSLILSACKQFTLTYNKILDRQRLLHKLKLSDDIVELPFWIWQEKEKRATIYIKFNNGKVCICKGDSEILDIDNLNIDYLVEIVDNLKDSYKIRPKALMLTLFARLFLCELWIHGVGGAEYEELNDRLAHEFLSISLPKYAIASATLYLNLNIPHNIKEEIRQLKNTLRRMKFNPEEFLNSKNLLIEAKKNIIEKMRKTRYKKELHDKLTIIDNKLRYKIIPHIQKLERAILEKEELLKIATNREFPFFIFSLEELKSMLEI